MISADVLFVLQHEIKQVKMELIELYKKLFSEFGAQGWWPADNGPNKAFEVCVGAILTQNTAWGNVEKALAALKRAKIFSCKKIANANKKKLAALIRSSGYFNQKAERLQLFCKHLQKNYSGSLEKLFSKPTIELRAELLSLKGIGKETADSILLYAAGRPVFVVDAYTKRLNERLKLSMHSDYDSLQRFFESSLPKDARLFAEFHALIVRFCKENCKKKPFCASCRQSKGCFFRSANELV